jgi:O-antigen/teichoic acid export membrane protein
MKQSQRIVKNAFFGIVAAVGGGAIQLAIILMIARAVSVTEFGKYSFVLAFAQFFGFVADAGLSRILVREVARERDDLATLVGAATSLIWVMSGAIGLFMLGIIPFLHLPLDAKWAAAIMGLATLCQFHSAGKSAIMRAREDNELNHLGFVLHKVVFFILVYLSIRLRYGLLGFVTANLLSNLLLWSFYHVVVARFYLRFRLVMNPSLWKSLLLAALPMGGGVMLRQLAMQLDILILTWLTNFTKVGLFSGPYRISMSLRLIPQTLALPLYPMYSRVANQSVERLEEVYQRSIKFFSLISFPIATVLTVWSDIVIRHSLGPRYEEAIPAMQLLGLGMIPFFASTLFPYLFAALDEQRRFLWSTCGCSLLRVFLIIILVPSCGFLAPCIGFLISEFVLVGIWIAQLAALGLKLSLGEVLWRPLLGSIVMGLILSVSRDFSLVRQASCGILSLVLYWAVVLLLKTLSPQELSMAKEGLRFCKPFIEHWTKTLKKNT